MPIHTTLLQAASVSVFNTAKGGASSISIAQSASVSTDGLGSCGANAAGQSSLPAGVGGSTVGTGGRPQCSATIISGCCSRSAQQPLFVGKNSTDWVVLQPIKAWAATARISGEGTGDLRCSSFRPFARGGGRVWLSADTIAINGVVSSRGTPPNLTVAACSQSGVGGASSGGTVIVTATSITGAGAIDASGGAGMQVSPATCSAAVAGGGGGRIVLQYATLDLVLKSINSLGGSVPPPSGAGQSTSCLRGSPGVLVLAQVTNSSWHNAPPFLYTVNVVNDGGTETLAATPLNINNEQNVASVSIGGTATVVSRLLDFHAGGYLLRRSGAAPTSPAASQGLLVSGAQLLPLGADLLSTAAEIYGPSVRLPALEAPTTSTADDAPPVATTSLNIFTTDVSLAVSSTLFSTGLGVYVQCDTFSQAAGGQIDISGSIVVQAAQSVTLSGAVGSFPVVPTVNLAASVQPFVLPEGTFVAAAGELLTVASGASVVASFVGLWSNKDINIAGAVASKSKKDTCVFPISRKSCEQMSWGASSAQPVPPINNYTLVISAGASGSLTVVAAAGSTNSGQVTSAAALLCGQQVTVAGSIVADALGCTAGEGPGKGHTGPGNQAGGGGGGHGGRGGKGAKGEAGGVAYDNTTLPVAVGSGGGTSGVVKSSAGGFIRIEAFEALNLLKGGVVNASAAQPTTGQTGGGASGGGVAIITGNLTGAGTINSRGADGGPQGGGGGGGIVGIAAPRPDILLQGYHKAQEDVTVTALSSASVLQSLHARVTGSSAYGALPMTCGERTRLAVALGAVCTARSGARAMLPVPQSLPAARPDRYAGFELVVAGFTASNFSGSVSVAGGQGQGGGQAGDNGTVSAPGCEPGYTALQCVACPVGTYKDRQGVGPCRPCTNGPSQSVYVGIATGTSSCSYTCNPGFRPPHCLSPFDTFLDDLGFYHLLLIAIFAAVCLGGIVLCALRCRNTGSKGDYDDTEATQQAALLDFAAPRRPQFAGAEAGSSSLRLNQAPPGAAAGAAKPGAPSDVADRLWAQLGSQFGLPSKDSTERSDSSVGLRTSLLAPGSQYGTAAAVHETDATPPRVAPVRPGMNFGRNIFCVTYRSVLQTRLALAPGDLKRHALRLYLAGSNSPGDPWHLHPIPRKDLQEFVDTVEWGVFVRKLNTVLAWPSTSCASWVLRLLHVIAPPAAGSLLTAWRANRAHKLLRVIANSDCSFMLHSREVALGDALRCTVSGEYTTAAIDLLADISKSSTTNPEEASDDRRSSASLTRAVRVGPRLPLALLLAGRGTVNSPWYLDPNDTMTRSVPLATGVTTFIHNSWVDFVAEFNARSRVVQRSALNASLPPLLAYLQWVNATSALTAGRRGMAGRPSGSPYVEHIAGQRASQREDSVASLPPLPSALRRLHSSNEETNSNVGRLSTQAQSSGGIHDSQSQDALLSSGHLGGIQLMLVRFWPTAQDSLTSFSLRPALGPQFTDRLTESDFQLGILVMLAPSPESDPRAAPVRPRAAHAARAGASQPIALPTNPTGSVGQQRGMHGASHDSRSSQVHDRFDAGPGASPDDRPRMSRHPGRLARRTPSWRSEHQAPHSAEKLSVVVGSYGAAPGSASQSSPLNRLVQQSIAKGYAMSHASGLGNTATRQGFNESTDILPAHAGSNSRTSFNAIAHGSRRRTTASPGGIDLPAATKDDPPLMNPAMQHSLTNSRVAGSASLGPLVAPDWGMDRQVPDAAFVPESRSPMVLLEREAPLPTLSARVNTVDTYRGRGLTVESVGSLLTDFGARAEDAPSRSSYAHPTDPPPYIMAVGGSVLGRRVDMTLPLPGLLFSFEGCGLPMPLPRLKDGSWWHPRSAQDALAAQREPILDHTAFAGYDSSQQAESILLAASATPYLGRGRWLASLAAGDRNDWLDEQHSSQLDRALNGPISEWEQPCEAISTALAGGSCLCVACAPVVLDESPQMAAVNCTRGHICAWLGCGIPVFSERSDSVQGRTDAFGRQSPSHALFDSPGAERHPMLQSRGPFMASPTLSQRSAVQSMPTQRTGQSLVLDTQQRAAVDTCAGIVSSCLMRTWMCFRCCLMRRALPWRVSWLMYLLCMLHVALLLTDVAGTGAMLISFSCLSEPQVNSAVTPAPTPAPDGTMPPELEGRVCSSSDAPFATSAVGSPWAYEMMPGLQESTLELFTPTTAVSSWAGLGEVGAPLDCSWLEAEAASLGTNASVLPELYRTWAARQAAKGNELENEPQSSAGSTSLGGGVQLPSESGKCSSLLLVLALVLPPGAIALAPLLGLAAMACFSPTAWAAFRSYHVRSYVPVIIVAVGVAYYASSLAGYEQLLPAGVLLAKMGVSQTAPQVLAWLSARRQQAGWRGLHEVQLFGYAGEREWI